MALQLVVDNTEYHNWLSSLMRAISRAPLQSITPEEREILTSVDPDEVVVHLSRAMALGL